MHAVQLTKVGRPLVDREVEFIPPGPGDVVVEVRAAGICHSDAHYRRGPRSVDRLPMTLGHEVSGVITQVGTEVDDSQRGERVCLHYQTSCGSCGWCKRGSEQFCAEGVMLGKGLDGGYAQYVTLPARNAVRLPHEIAFEHAAVMMCSSATSYHALRKGRLRAGESVAVFGAGGLGASAIQIAIALGADGVYGVDLDPEKLRLAEKLGAIPVDASSGGAASQIREMTAGVGVDVALELVGLSATVRDAVESLAIMGRAIIVGISDQPVDFVPFEALALGEREMIGCMDHLLADIPPLLDMAVAGQLDLTPVVAETVPLDAGAINAALDQLEAFAAPARTVIVPGPG